MKVEQLPSGAYRVRVMVKGKRHSLSFDHKPTRREVYRELEERAESEPTNSITFEKAAKEYVNSKRNILSAASIREYERECERLPEWFTKMDIESIDQITMQKLVNEMAQTLSAKTVKNRHSFCVGVIRLFIPSASFYTTLPKKVVKEPYIPSQEDIKTILDYSKGGRYEIALRLACYGLRRGEICALEKSDLSKDNILSINKALVENSDKEWVLKTTKTTSSIRYVPIDAELAKMIRALKTKKVFNGYPGTIRNYLSRTQDKLKMKHFSLHKFRHYFCTTLSESGVSENDICALGGWKQGGTSNVMKQVYRHSNIERDKKRQQEVSNIISKSME